MIETASLILSSVCANAAAVTVMGAHVFAREKKETQSCSQDLMVLMFCGTLFRAYWSHSPPEVWSEEHIILQLGGQVDSFISPLVWGTLLATVGQATKFRAAVRPVYAQWNYLLGAAIAIGLFLPLLLPFHELPEEAFPLTISAAIANLLVELSAMIPQTLLTAHGWQNEAVANTNVNKVEDDDHKYSMVNGKDELSCNLSPLVNTHLAVVQRRWAASSTPHFVGFLALARVFRIIFWLSTVWSMWADTHEGDWALVTTLVLPDVLQTLLFGDFLMQWLRQFKETTVDPFVEKVSLTL